jgi:hypothetical protein
VKTVSISLDEATWRAAAQVAAQQHTTLDGLLAGLLKKVASQEQNGGEEYATKSREELVRALEACNAVVGEKPSRERTYSDRRFHRH